MVGNNPEVGRNLSSEIDEIKGRMNDMNETQARLEAILHDIRQSLNSVVANRGTKETEVHVSTQPITSTIATLGMNLHHEQPTHTTMVIPIGEGYRTMENVNHDIPVHAGPTWEQPYVSIPGQPMGFHSGSRHGVTQTDKVKEKWREMMEKHIKAIRGPNTYGSLGIEDMCPTSGVKIPKDFKVPDFSKYDGSTNPLFHLKTYCTKMAIWSKDERFLMNFFHESLTGPDLEWYIQLDHSKIGCWRDLAELFMGQYRFNMDTAPTREQLRTLQKKNGENFKQYAQRWRALAAQVQPPLTLPEMCSYFLGTLGSPYIGAMAGVAYGYFYDLIIVGERIEVLAKVGKLPMENVESSMSEKGSQLKKDENEVNYIQKPTSLSTPISTTISNIPNPTK